jgi:AraC-like DNA-binding protein
MGLGWGWFNGMAGDNQPHAHHAIQILIAESPQSLWTAETGWAPFAGVMIGADVRHQLAPTREAVSLIYVEPDSDAGQILSRRIQGAISHLSPDEIQRARRRLSESVGPTPDESLVSALTGAVTMLPQRDRDERIGRVIASLPTPLPERFAASALAEQAGLSLSRFQHRFRAHTGMALRPYLRWRRLLTSLAAMMQGCAITDAALAGGFADAAHFTRTVRRHFGIPPSALSALRGA